MTVSNGLWIRWSGRDLRRRWAMVSAIALIVSVGTGVYAGLGGTTGWRLASNDASYAALGFHDLKAMLPLGGYVEAGSLRQAAATVDHAAWIAAAEERLVVPTQIDASTSDGTVLVPGQIVGSAPDASIDLVHLTAGAAPAAPAAQPAAVLESKFAGVHRLDPAGTVRVSGGTAVPYTGLGYSPEYFRIVGRSGSLTTEYGFGVLFTSLADAQTLSGQQGKVNDLVLRLTPDADPAVVAGELRQALAGLGATVEGRDDDIVYHGMYQDAYSDQKTWDFFAFLILAGAAFAAFNLISRLVEAERRQLGVGMALGASPRSLAIRPLLIGVEVAALGALVGIPVGMAAALGMQRVLEDAMPLPVWITPFPFARYLQGAALGLAIPFVATVVPVMRAVRLEPVDALRSVPGAGGKARRAVGVVLPLTRRLPGPVLALLPLRNLLRAGRRTLFTALGIAAAVTTLVAVLAMFDSVFTALDRIDTELTSTSPDRLQMTLDGYYPTSGLMEQAAGLSAPITDAQPGLRVGGTLRAAGAGGDPIDTSVELLDMDGAMWTPRVVAGRLPAAGGGIVLADKAARDLGVGVGDTVVLHHPVRQGTTFVLVDSEVRVSALHDNPLRFLAYLDLGDARLFGLVGMTNVVTVRPAPGASAEDVKVALFSEPGVATIESVGGIGPQYRERFSAITGILRIIEAASLTLALLIAFNSAGIAMEERVREQATMFAFGLPVRTVMRLLMTESLLVGILGTALGLGGGYLAGSWSVHQFTTTTVPEVAVRMVLTAGTVLVSIVLGVLVVAAAPLLALRRLTRLDVSSRLRVLE